MGAQVERPRDGHSTPDLRLNVFLGEMVVLLTNLVVRIAARQRRTTSKHAAGLSHQARYAFKEIARFFIGRWQERERV